MNIQTPTDWIIEQLLTKGSVSRNDSLNKRVTNRLGAYIKDMASLGWKFDSRKSKTGECMLHGQYVKTKYGRDYVYVLVNAPKGIKRTNR